MNRSSNFFKSLFVRKKRPKISEKEIVEIVESYDLDLPLKVIIFNHTTFDNSDLTERSIEVGEKLAACFRDDLNIEDVDYNLNFNVEEIRNHLQQVVKEGEKYSGLIICISSHGDLDEYEDDYQEIIHAKDKTYSKQDLWLPFETTIWKNKPKLIFIQACRGSDATPGVTFTHDSVTLKAAVLPPFAVPKYPDLFIVNASQPGTVSFRYDDDTPFVEALIDTFKQRAKTWSLLEMTTFICHDVALSFEACSMPHEKYECSKQMPCFESTLTKEFFFPCKSDQEEVFVKEYEFTNKGLAWIFLYDYDGTDFPKRRRVGNDASTLVSAFSDIDLECQCYGNFTEDMFFKQLNNHSRLSNYDMLLVVFSGYGERDEIYLADVIIKMNQIWQPFLGNNCPELIGKPKVFIISGQAPLVDDPDMMISEGVSGKFDRMVIKMSKQGNVQKCVCDHSNDNINIPITADMLICFETAAGRTTYEEKNYNGTLFFKYLCNELLNDKYDDFLSVLTGTIQRFIKIAEANYGDQLENYRETPIFFSSLRKIIPINRKTGSFD